MEKELDFSVYTQISEQGKVIGFKLEGDPFVYRYDQHGGWYDAKGNYYNSDAEKCQPPDSSDEDEPLEQQPNEEAVLQAKPQASTQRQQAVRELLELIDSYPEEALVEVTYEDDKRVVDSADLNKLLEEKHIGAVFKDSTAHVSKAIATELAELQGTKHKDSTLYIFVRLHASDTVQAIFNGAVTERELVVMLQNLELEKNKDFGNIEIDGEQAVFELAHRHFERVDQSLKCERFRAI